MRKGEAVIGIPAVDLQFDLLVAQKLSLGATSIIRVPHETEVRILNARL